ncbi:MAG TPA: SAM-dependent methyltransferase [Legionella sp.]|nr:SAM-dependent methyltransferase [Legionella sp.]
MPNLIVVGSGIKSISHLTEETKRVIQNSDKVLYLVNENNLKAWIEREAKFAESLEPIYFNSPKRIDAYHNITQCIINEYERVNNLCVVFYGHPTVFASSALTAVEKVKAMRGNAIILPAVSAMDCLFSELRIDPGERGCFSIDATELLLYERVLDIFSHVILWQLFNLGMHDRQFTSKLYILVDYLNSYYPIDHPVCLYEGAMLPTQKSRVEWIKLEQLKNAEIKPTSTLYIKPVIQKQISTKYLKLLEINIEDYVLSAELNTSSK